MAPHPATPPRPQKEEGTVKKSYFSRPISDGIKGISLIFMFAYHFFAFPQWYIPSISFPHLKPLAPVLGWTLKICVPVFAFLTGYFFVLGKDKSYRHSLRKIRDTLAAYWMVYIPFLLLALVLGCWSFSPGAAIREAFGLSSEVMIFGWYIYFYCAVMLLLPLAHRFSTGTLWADALILGILPLTAFTAAQELLPESTVAAVASSLRGWAPCVISGFLFAKYDLFETVLQPLEAHFPSHRGKILLWLTLAAFACGAKAFLIEFGLLRANIHGLWVEVSLNMDVFYAPLFLYATKNLLEQVKWGWVLPLLGKIGRESMLMWFLHCLFFNCCAEYTQPLLFWPRLAILVLPWGLALCYTGARLLRLPLDFLLGRKRKIS